MGFFEDNFASIGRRLDDGVEWLADRRRSLTDRHEHRARAESIGRRLDKLRAATTLRAAEAIENARDRWWRQDLSGRQRATRLAIAGGATLTLLALGTFLWMWNNAPAPVLTPEEIALIQRAMEAPAERARPDGLDAWFQTSTRP